MKCTSQFDNTDNPIIISDSLVCDVLYLMLLILKCIISSSLYGNVILDMAGVRGHRWSLSRPHRSLLPDSAVSTKLTFVFRTDMDAATMFAVITPCVTTQGVIRSRRSDRTMIFKDISSF